MHVPFVTTPCPLLDPLLATLNTDIPFVGPLPAILTLTLSDCAQHRRTLCGSAQCNSDSDSLVYMPIARLRAHGTCNTMRAASPPPPPQRSRRRRALPTHRSGMLLAAALSRAPAGHQQRGIGPGERHGQLVLRQGRHWLVVERRAHVRQTPCFATVVAGIHANASEGGQQQCGRRDASNSHRDGVRTARVLNATAGGLWMPASRRGRCRHRLRSRHLRGQPRCSHKRCRGIGGVNYITHRNMFEPRCSDDSPPLSHLHSDCENDTGRAKRFCLILLTRAPLCSVESQVFAAVS
eukprot:366112-Chlamydomonas_euryale.AAC.33